MSTAYVSGPTEGLDPRLVAGLDKLARRSGRKFVITSGRRTEAEQAYLLAHPQGYPVAAPGTSLHACTRANGLYSYWLISACCACNCLSQTVSSASAAIVARIGRVLMNSPTIDSTSATCAERPDTTTPKTTSSLRLSELNNKAHAP